MKRWLAILSQMLNVAGMCVWSDTFSSRAWDRVCVSVQDRNIPQGHSVPFALFIDFYLKNFFYFLDFYQFIDFFWLELHGGWPQGGENTYIVPAPLTSAHTLRRLGWRLEPAEIEDW